MNKLNHPRILVALSLLPSLILFFIGTVSASNTGQVKEFVTVASNAEMTCQPDPLIVGSIESRFTCIIEPKNFEVSQIIPSSLRLYLSELPVAHIPVASDSPNLIGDSNRNGIPDLKVTFDKKIVESWFSSLFLPQYFTFNIDSLTSGQPNSFTTSESILVINPSITLVKFLGQDGSLNVAKGIDLGTAKIRASTIDGTVLQSITFNRTKQGLVYPVITKTAHLSADVDGIVPVMILQRTLFNVPFSAWARYDGSNCTLTPPSSVTCDGPGKYFRSFPFGLFEEKANIHFSTDGKTANITALQGSNKVFESLNMPLKNFNFWITPR